MQPLTAGQLVWPGQPITAAEAATAGPGTLQHGAVIHASVPGRYVEIETQGERQVSVERLWDRFRGKGLPVLPAVNTIILGRVVKIRSKEATINIFAVGETVCQQTFQGVVRIQDVRATDKDSVKIHISFRPGDIVRAQVISLGDASSYYLSTARDDLGVVFATDSMGQVLRPINSQKMYSEATGAIEKRKCAIMLS